MAQIFRIRQNSELPTLRMELIEDGHIDFINRNAYNNAIQNADITFSMKNEKGVLKISKAKANIVKPCDDCCDEPFIIEYVWKKRDTKEVGKYEGWFEITFNDDIYEEGVEYPSGTLIMPIHEPLYIYIN